MVIDEDPSTADSSKKGKAPFKKVTPEKRPEVKLLEYVDVPGFSICAKYRYLQKLVTPPVKRAKVEHPCSDPGMSPFYLCNLFTPNFSTVPGAPTRQMHEFKGCSAEALSVAESVAAGAPITPSRVALQAHISDLESELRNVDFRLQNFYHQRTVVSGILEDAVKCLSSNDD